MAPKVDQTSHSGHFCFYKMSLSFIIEIRSLVTSASSLTGSTLSHDSFSISSPFVSLQLKRVELLLVYQLVRYVLQHFSCFTRFLSRLDVVFPSDGLWKQRISISVVKSVAACGPVWMWNLIITVLGVEPQTWSPVYWSWLGRKLFCSTSRHTCVKPTWRPPAVPQCWDEKALSRITCCAPYCSKTFP